MSELKAFDIVVAEEYYCEGIVKYRRAVYDKSEADKVIAHQKYKRCLAMAYAEWLKQMSLYNFPESILYRRATWLEVARWCATGNGLVYDTDRDKIDTGIMFKPSNESEPIMESIKVRKWSDTEWHEPTVDYLFGGDK